MTKYIAHSKDEERGVEPQPYEEHILNVVNICQRNLNNIKDFCEPSIYKVLEMSVLLAAEFHDIGKLDSQPQAVLYGGDQKMLNHVDAGVSYLLSQYKKSNDLLYLISAYLVHAHHIGFLNYNRLIKDEWSFLSVNIKPNLNGFRDLKSCLKYDMKDIPVYKRIDSCIGTYLSTHRKLIPIQGYEEQNQNDCGRVLDSFLILKVALSILCDADHEDTSKNYKEPYPHRQIPLNAKKRLKLLTDYVDGLGGSKNEVSERNRFRKTFFGHCLKVGEEPISLIDGTVGIGKTVGMMANALKTADTYGLNTIFVISPYIALIEQSSEVYRDGITFSEKDREYSINEIHSVFDVKSLFHRKYLKGFNAPINLTSSVNFFETITANRTGALKNIHKIIGSVITIDEYHTIASYKHWPLLLNILSDLTEFFSCRVILSSGTPEEYWEIESFAKTLRPDSPFNDVHRVIPIDFYREMLRQENARVKTVTILDKELSFEDLYNKLKRSYHCNFVVFNTRKKACRFAQFIKGRLKRKVYLRYSGLSPKDRKLQLKQIKSDIKEGKSIILVATEGADVGLDLSFRHSFKELSSFNGILQIRGRTNRNCEFKNSKLIIFELQKCPLDDGEKFHNNPSLTKRAMAFKSNPTIHKDISPSYCTLMVEQEISEMTKSDEDDSIKFCQHFFNKNFEFMDEDFKLISAPSVSVLVDKTIFGKMMQNEKVRWSEIQENIVNLIASPYQMEKIESLLVPLEQDENKNFNISEKKEAGKSIEGSEDEDDNKPKYNQLYFWAGEYDSEYGIFPGIESGKNMNFLIV